MVGTKRTVLIVDDDSDVRDSLVMLLSMEQYVVRLADSRERALDLLAFGEPDVVLLDWFMPGMGIEEFVNKARKIYPALQMILISASLNTRQKATELNLKQHLTKPCEPTEILKAIDVCIQQRRKE
jgi:two-component system phosphate regulon response regulator PhoB